MDDRCDAREQPGVREVRDGEHVVRRRERARCPCSPRRSGLQRRVPPAGGAPRRPLPPPRGRLSSRSPTRPRGARHCGGNPLIDDAPDARRRPPRWCAGCSTTRGSPRRTRTPFSTHPKTLAGPHLAERLGVPALVAAAVPMLSPTRAFPVPGLVKLLARRLAQLARPTACPRPPPARSAGTVDAWRDVVLDLPPAPHGVRDVAPDGSPAAAALRVQRRGPPAPGGLGRGDARHRRPGPGRRSRAGHPAPGRSSASSPSGCAAGLRLGFGSMPLDDPRRSAEEIVAGSAAARACGGCSTARSARSPRARRPAGRAPARRRAAPSPRVPAARIVTWKLMARSVPCSAPPSHRRDRRSSPPRSPVDAAGTPHQSRAGELRARVMP